MSDFARGVVGVFVVGIVAGAGALMFIPKNSPSASQVANIQAPAPACASHSPGKNDAACQKSTAEHRDSGKKDVAAERVLSSANSVATNGRTAAGLVTVDAQAIAALRRGESLQPEPAPEASAAAPELAATPTTTAAAAQPAAAPPAANAATRRVAYTTARRAPPAHRTARQNAAYRAYGSTRNRGFAMGFSFFPSFR